jgi:hypothetical protein
MAPMTIAAIGPCPNPHSLSLEVEGGMVTVREVVVLVVYGGAEMVFDVCEGEWVLDTEGAPESGGMVAILEEVLGLGRGPSIEKTLEFEFPLLLRSCLIHSRLKRYVCPSSKSVAYEPPKVLFPVFRYSLHVNMPSGSLVLFAQRASSTVHS